MKRRKRLSMAAILLSILVCGGGLILLARSIGQHMPSVRVVRQQVSSVAPSSAPAASSVRGFPQPDWSSMSGSLVGLRMESEVGVVLDEVPRARRDAVAAAILGKPQSFWTDRARRQVKMTSLRLDFRDGFYPTGTKKQLPLPPERQWEIELLGAPERRSVGGHDAVVTGYRFTSTLLSDEASPGVSEPALAAVGGTWTEPFVFPVDPELLFQRTGFACMNEGQFPPNSVDAEETDLFYDHGCKVERQLTNVGCHQTQMPKTSCLQALDAEVGRVETGMRFERLAWDPARAADVRLGTITNPDGPDLEPDPAEFRQHRFTYRYVPQDSCTIVEDCVGGPGWRQLLMFPTADLNRGAKALDIGTVDYFLKQGETTLSKHGVFELSECHGHYHFSYYGSFTLGDATDAITRKNGFCLQPTNRLWNNELSPLHHPYTDCIEQGVASGWIDEYKMGLECQWLDVTGVEKGERYPLAFETNPDGFLCEGRLQRDEKGDVIFDRTERTTEDGRPVDRPRCAFFPEWQENNRDSYDVRIPAHGESYVTGECREGLFGELRNCGFSNEKTLRACEPGETVRLRCAAPEGSPVQAVRVCEGSRALASGIPCTYNEALGSAAVDGTQEVSFACPAARDAVETGGAYAVMTAPLLPWEKAAAVTCEPV